MQKYVIVTFLSALMYVGCTPHMAMSSDAEAKDASCKSSNSSSDCYIVVDAWLEEDGSCTAAVLKSQEMVEFKKDARDKKIEWRFSDTAEHDGYRFLPNGIEPKATPSGNIDNWNDNFDADMIGGGKKFKLKNKNKASQPHTIDYFYKVRVQLERPHLAPLTCKVQDPVIRNRR